MVELLVVIAIIGVLVALLLPAIQAAREAARRSSCTNNVKQIGVALQNFHSALNRFPYGMQWVDLSIQTSARLHWTFAVMPYMEQTALNDLADWSAGFRFQDAVTNDRVFRTKLPFLACPSDDQGVNSVYSDWSRSNYVACFSPDGRMVEPGVELAIVDACNNLPNRNPSRLKAVFNVNVERGLKHITDGSSNTVAISEVITGPDRTGDVRGCWWNDWGIHYTHLNSPNSPIPDRNWNAVPELCDAGEAPCTNNSPCWTTVTYSARSHHVGGVTVGRADGSVSFASNDIDLLAWQALGSIDGGETDFSNAR